MLQLRACVHMYVCLCVCVSTYVQVHTHICVCLHICALFLFCLSSWGEFCGVGVIFYLFSHALKSSKFLAQPESNLLLVKAKQNTSQAPGSTGASGSRPTLGKGTPAVRVWLGTGQRQGWWALQIVGSQLQPRGESDENQRLGVSFFG